MRPRSETKWRAGVASLCAAGLADALYMLAYQKGWIDSMACPFFRDGCERVARSPQARLLGVSNAAVGALGYATMGTLALGLGVGPARDRPLTALTLGGAVAAAVVASAILIWAQAYRVRAWCFWCLSSAAVNVALVPLVAPDARASLDAPRGPLRLPSTRSLPSPARSGAAR